ncbi:MAG: hypothetical protein ACJ70Z_04875 [Nitrososphaera sp.]
MSLNEAGENRFRSAMIIHPDYIPWWANPEDKPIIGHNQQYIYFRQCRQRIRQASNVEEEQTN